MMRLPRQIWVVFVLGTLNSLGWGATMPFLAVYLEIERHVPLSIIGLTYLVTGFVTLVSQLLGGRLTDLLGSKTVLLIGYGCSIVTSIVLGLMIEFRASVEFIILLYPVFSFVRTFSQPAAFAIVAGEDVSNLRTGFSIISIGGNLGWAIGPALGGILAQVYDYSSVFLLSAVSAIIVTLVTLLMVEGGRAINQSSTKQVKALLSWTEDRNLIFFLALTLAAFTLIGFETTPLSLYVAGFLKFSNEEIGLLFATNGIVIVILQLPLTRSFARFRNLVTPVVSSTIAAAVAFFLASISTTFPEMEVVTIIVTLGEILLTVPAQMILSLFSRTGNRGIYQGYYSAVTNSGYSLSAFFGPVSFSLFFFRPSLAWIVVGALSLAVGLGFVLLSSGLQKDYENQVRHNEQLTD
jgi:predicted MFS family arabinose efflux permease